MIERDLTNQLRQAARDFPAVTITGPRQSGKSTLCRAIFPQHTYVNLEAPDTRAFATNDPRAFLAQFANGVIIDEIQRCPELPSYLQERIDADPKPGRWILTGSQNLAMLSSVSQSLAGRTAVMHLLPLTHAEILRFLNPPSTLDATLLAGGYPRIFDRKLDPGTWIRSYVATYLDRDVRSLSQIGDLTVFERFLTLCAGRTAQLLNLSALAGDCGITQPTAKAWLSILEASFIVFRLPSFSGNLRKRMTKMPKLHFYDTGLACWLLGIRNSDQLHAYPLRGAIFETWVVSEILKHRTNAGEYAGLYFYRDQHGVEVDLIVERAAHLTLVEAKSAQTAASDFFDSLRRGRAVFANHGGCDAAVIYGGDTAQHRSDARLIPWTQLEKEKWA